LSAVALAQVLRPIEGMFKSSDYPDLLVGLQTPDDAAVWRLDKDRAMVLTTDFFTPVVDDPYDYGAIAAANALSDVYAMGGKPALALNVAALPTDLPVEISQEIFRGGAEKCREAGVVIAGGHTVRDEEPKYGLVVVGFVDPAHVLTKAGARVGDRLILTKPLGFGVTTTALKRELADKKDIAEVVGWMKKLNREASNLAVGLGLNCATDVTGFSLLGHGVEIAHASQVKLILHFNDVPFVSCAQKYAAMKAFAGGAVDNKNFYEKDVRFSGDVELNDRMLLFDPQTSGGLLMSVPEKKIVRFEKMAKEIQQPYWIIGEVVEGEGIDVG
jgi:selenide, water dikinase